MNFNHWRAVKMTLNQTYLELVQLQLIGIFTNTENILQVDRSLNVLHTQLLEAGKLKTKGQFVYIHN